MKKIKIIAPALACAAPVLAATVLTGCSANTSDNGHIVQPTDKEKQPEIEAGAVTATYTFLFKESVTKNTLKKPTIESQQQISNDANSASNAEVHLVSVDSYECVGKRCFVTVKWIGSKKKSSNCSFTLVFQSSKGWTEKVANCKFSYSAPSIESIVVSGSPAVGIGNTSKYYATVTGSGVSQNVTWSLGVGEDAYASINAETGVLTGKKTGTVHVTATSVDITTKVSTPFEVTILCPALTGITINQTSAELKPDETLQLSVTSYTPAAAAQNIKSIKYYVPEGQQDIATVSSKGLVTCHDTAGNATVYITVTDNYGNEVFETCSINVPETVKKVTITEGPTELTYDGATAGGPYKAEVTGTKGISQEVTWALASEAEEKIAEIRYIDGQPYIWPLDNGTVHLIATSKVDTDKHSDPYTITIKRPSITGFTIGLTIGTTMTERQTQTISYKNVQPATAKAVSAAYSIKSRVGASEAKIVVDKTSGLYELIPGTEEGSVVISVVLTDTNDKKYEETQTITIKNVVDSVVVSGGATSVKMNPETLPTYTATVTGSTGLKEKGVTWSVDNTSLATIDASTGVLTPNTTGTTGTVNVYATSIYDSSKKSDAYPVKILYHDVESISLNKTSTSIEAAGGTDTINISTVTPETISKVKSTTFTVDDPDLVEVTKDSETQCTLKAKDTAAGTTTLRVKSTGSNDEEIQEVTCSISVYTTIETVAITDAPTTLAWGASYDCTATVSGKGTVAQDVTWAVTSGSGASFSGGKLTSTKDAAPGVIKIQATATGTSIKSVEKEVTITGLTDCTVTPSSTEEAPYEVDLYEKIEIVTSNYVPSTMTISSVSFVSSDETVLKDSGQGSTGLGSEYFTAGNWPGTATVTITITPQYGSAITKYCYVKVIAPK